MGKKPSKISPRLQEFPQDPAKIPSRSPKIPSRSPKIPKIPPKSKILQDPPRSPQGPPKNLARKALRANTAKSSHWCRLAQITKPGKIPRQPNPPASSHCEVLNEAPFRGAFVITCDTWFTIFPGSQPSFPQYYTSQPSKVFAQCFPHVHTTSAWLARLPACWYFESKLPASSRKDSKHILKRKRCV